MIFIDLSHTCHTGAMTGIQKVCRRLLNELEARGEALPLTWDPFWQTWRGLRHRELQSLKHPKPVRKRGAVWPVSARIKGRLLRWRGVQPQLGEARGLVVPELFSSKVAAALPRLFASVHGPKIAIFHDAIALKHPELSPPGTVARFPSYLQELAAFDGIAAVSEDSKSSLLDYWAWLGLHRTPRVEVIPLGIVLPPAQAPALPGSRILCVGSIEGRKNHVSLLKAAASLWAEGRSTFSLHIIGTAQHETGKEALSLIEELQRMGRPLIYAGPASDEALAAAYRSCRFTVYPSRVEGFGLPVLESLSYGKPCICSSKGALGESARGGGCLALDSVDAPSLSEAIRRLLTSDAELARLSGEASARRFKTWPEYARDLLAWMGSL